ncbi:MAG: FAD:protein FMN transferase [Acidobacteria bacterium]|nr:FAD:protein FMN transferase [Acidobacteriota bacterium]MBI3422037.1 FAD:protein FMN transferase [Acidobacteriota bacterium]
MEAQALYKIDCQRACEAMGTRFELFLRGADAEHLDSVAVAVLEEIQRLDATLSRFDPRSEIARLNRDAARKPIRVDRELFALLARCQQARVLTGGYFDVTKGAALALEAETGSVRLSPAEAYIDLGAVGKGYALDCGRAILQRFGVTSALLHGGASSVLAVGADAWPVALRHPQTPEHSAGRIALAERALSCSAVRHVGQAQSDVVNPLTGAALNGDDACVVLAASATEAEVFSTALLAMGRAAAAQYLAAHAELNLAVGWLEPSGTVCWLKET